MNGVHDMGGMQGFGKVEPEPNEPVFHSEWEGADSRSSARWARPAPGTSTMSRRHRGAAARRLSRALLLQEMVAAARRHARRARSVRR